MSVSLSTSSYTTIMITPDQEILRKNRTHMPKTMMTIMMMMMMMIMTDPFTTNLVVKGPVAKGAVVKGAHPYTATITITNTIIKNKVLV